MEFGSFFVGGREVAISGRAKVSARLTETVTLDTDPNGAYRVDQAYVQWFRPAGGGPKVVLQHGGGLCGTIWEGTPDGRPGWAQELLRQGFEVYVVDNAERGRAGWCPYPETWDGEPLLRSAEETWALYRIGSPEGFAARRPFDGQLFPAHAFEALLPFNVPRWSRSTDAAVAALEAVIRRIGRCSVISHSQGGEIALRATERIPHLVDGLVLIEPSGSVRGCFGAEFSGKRVLVLLGDFLDRHPVFRILERLTERWSEELRSVGAQVEIRRLPGHSHMMMMDRQSERIASDVAAWLGTGSRLTPRPE